MRMLGRVAARASVVASAVALLWACASTLHGQGLRDAGTVLRSRLAFAWTGERAVYLSTPSGGEESRLVVMPSGEPMRNPVVALSDTTLVATGETGKDAQLFVKHRNRPPTWVCLAKDAEYAYATPLVLLDGRVAVSLRNGRGSRRWAVVVDVASCAVATVPLAETAVLCNDPRAPLVTCLESTISQRSLDGGLIVHAQEWTYGQVSWLSPARAEAGVYVRDERGVWRLDWADGRRSRIAGARIRSVVEDDSNCLWLGRTGWIGRPGVLLRRSDSGACASIAAHDTLVWPTGALGGSAVSLIRSLPRGIDIHFHNEATGAPLVLQAVYGSAVCDLGAVASKEQHVFRNVYAAGTSLQVVVRRRQHVLRQYEASAAEQSLAAAVGRWTVTYPRD